MEIRFEICLLCMSLFRAISNCFLAYKAFCHTGQVSARSNYGDFQGSNN